MRATEFMDQYKMPAHVKGHDLDVVAWCLYSTTSDNVTVNIVQEPMSEYESQAKNQWAEFKRRTHEKRKVESMIRSIQGGNFSLPIYVGSEDQQHQVVEGRHRLCAYWLSKSRTLPVAYVREK